METAKVTQRNNVLESENKLLLSEMDQLRDVRDLAPLLKNVFDNVVV